MSVSTQWYYRKRATFVQFVTQFGLTNWTNVALFWLKARHVFSRPGLQQANWCGMDCVAILLANYNLCISLQKSILPLNYLINEHALLTWFNFLCKNKKCFHHTLIFHVINEKIFPPYSFIPVCSFIGSSE
jgi:hypothetical protein